MVSFAESASSRARFVFPVIALAASLTWLAVSSNAAHPPDRRGIRSIGGCHDSRFVTPRATHHIYIGLMVGQADNLPYLHLMEDTINASLASSGRARSWVRESLVTAPGDGELVQGVALSGTLDELAVIGVADGRTQVGCKITMTVTGYPDGGLLGRFTASARVDSSPDDEALARHNCVASVIADLVDQQLIPAIASTR